MKGVNRAERESGGCTYDPLEETRKKGEVSRNAEAVERRSAKVPSSPALLLLLLALMRAVMADGLVSAVLSQPA